MGCYWWWWMVGFWWWWWWSIWLVGPQMKCSTTMPTLLIWHLLWCRNYTIAIAIANRMDVHHFYTSLIIQCIQHKYALITPWIPFCWCTTDLCRTSTIWSTIVLNLTLSLHILSETIPTIPQSVIVKQCNIAPSHRSQNCWTSNLSPVFPLSR